MATDVSDRDSALEFLYSRINYERLANVPYSLEAFKLDRMQLLLARVGDPHLALRAVHIAGTKGKGSTAAMIAAVLQGAGYKTALYSSPHLERLEERFVIDGNCISAADFVGLCAELVPVVKRMDEEGLSGGIGAGLTFFEITTALGLLFFARHNVEIAVLEVGLGGRLDSTNVCRPEVSVITSISYDHMKQLGSTLAEIAREKAGIIKHGVPVISGVTADEPRQVIEQIADEQQAPLSLRGRDFDFANVSSSDDARGERFDYWESSPQAGLSAHGVNGLLSGLRSVEISLLGAHQCANAAVAIATLRQLSPEKWDIPEAAIRQGLLAARCSARIQILGRNPTVVLDVAHNGASVRALVDVLQKQFPRQRPTLIFASSRDKDVAAMMQVLLPACETLILTQYVTNPRAMETAELAAIAREVAGQLSQDAAAEIVVEPSPAAAWRRACQVNRGLVCITGSFFLAADMAEVMRKGREDLRFEI